MWSLNRVGAPPGILDGLIQMLIPVQTTGSHLALVPSQLLNCAAKAQSLTGIETPQLIRIDSKKKIDVSCSVVLVCEHPACLLPSFC